MQVEGRNKGVGERRHCSHWMVACMVTGPWKGVLGEGRARRILSVIQNFKNRCHVIWGCWVSGKTGLKGFKMGSFCGKSVNFGVFRGF